jgi:hypothetical protein
VEQAKEFKSEFQIAQKNRKENMRIEKNIRKGEPMGEKDHTQKMLIGCRDVCFSLKNTIMTWWKDWQTEI